MAIARGFASAAMLAGLAIGLAAPASAAPVMSGHYIMTTTATYGLSFTENWYFTPCGNGCASVVDQGQLLGYAQFVSGQWTLDYIGWAGCPDGSYLPNANSSHLKWDPDTLVGTIDIISFRPGCGSPVGGGHGTQAVQFRHVP
jgi:hypothetical protein